MDHERARVADVRELREELESVRHLDAGRLAALDAEDDHAALSVREILLGERVARVVREARIANPRHLRMRREVLGDGERVLAVPRDAERQRLDALEKDPAGVRRQRRALVAQGDGAKARDERERPEGLAPLDAVVAGVRLDVERVFLLRPVELARVDHDAADARAVSADPLRERVDDDVRAELDRLLEDGRRERRVHDEGESVPVGDFGILLDVGDAECRVADRLDVDEARLLVDRGLDGGEVVEVRPPHADVVRLRQDRVELDERAAVDVVRRDELGAGLGDVGDGEVDGGGAGGDGERGGAAFERGEAFLKDILGRVHEAGVDVRRFFKGEAVGAVLGALEVVGRRAVDRHGAGIRRRVPVPAGVHRQRLLVQRVVVHVSSLLSRLTLPLW